MKLRSHDINSIISALKIMLLFPTEGFPGESALWFLPVMFLTSVGYAVVRKYLDLRWASVVVVIIGIIGFAFPALASFRLPWGIDTACVALLFFHTGYLIKRLSLIDRIKGIRTNKSWLFWLCFSIVFVANIALIYLNEKVNLRLIQYGNPILTYVNAITGTLIWMVIADVLASSKKTERVNALFCEISKLSIIFLCTNHITLRLVGFVLRKGFGVLGIKTQVIYYLVQFVFAMPLMLFAGRIIDKSNLRIIMGRKRINE